MRATGLTWMVCRRNRPWAGSRLRSARKAQGGRLPGALVRLRGPSNAASVGAHGYRTASWRALAERGAHQGGARRKFSSRSIAEDHRSHVDVDHPRRREQWIPDITSDLAEMLAN